ncbi:MAG: right-handed parallel beta-helix repeat-containing protein [Planctomycetota bacterium]|nr:MAG: right-handed parallel beta-helix repeat-containing protein [Planctomycetota bacterium]
MPGGGDPDYANIDQAEANIVTDTELTSKDLVSQGKNVVYRLYGSWKRAYGEQVSGWTCDATYKLKVVAGEGRPLIYDDSNKSHSYRYTLRICSDYVEVSGIHLIANTSNASYDQNYALCIYGGTEYVKVTDCILDSTTPGSAYNYAANLHGSGLVFENCTITGDYGFYELSYGGGDENNEIRNCVFTGLSKTSIYIYEPENVKIHGNKWMGDVSGYYAVHLPIAKSFQVYNNLINASSLVGGGIYVSSTDDDHTESYIVNNTIYSINAPCIKLYRIMDGQTEVRNNVFYLTGAGYGLWYYDVISARVTSDNNCFYDSGGNAYFGRWNINYYYETKDDWYDARGMDYNSIEADPDFENLDPESEGWLHLEVDSPCIDAGDNSAVPEDITADIDGDQRIFDGDDDGTATVDMGADEQCPTVITAISDDEGDLYLQHTHFEEYYGVDYDNNDVIPDAFDIKKVTISKEGSNYIFGIETHDDIQSAFNQHGDNAQFGFFINNDNGNESDLTAITNNGGNGAVLVEPDFDLIESISSSISGNSIKIYVPSSYLNEGFTWLAASFFALPPGKALPTPTTGIYVSPVVDTIASNTNFSVIIDSIERWCEPQKPKMSALKGCPVPEGTNRTRDVNPSDGNNLEDWLVHDEEFPIKDSTKKLRVEAWAISTSATGPNDTDYWGKLVYIDENGNDQFDAGDKLGWGGRCAYDGGVNKETIYVDNDGNAYKFSHRSYDEKAKHDATDDDNDDRKDMSEWITKVDEDKTEASNRETKDGKNKSSTSKKFPIEKNSPDKLKCDKKDLFEITTYGTLPVGMVTRPYSYTLKTSTLFETASAFSWSNQGALPKGLTLGTNGVIAGTPQQVETKPFMVTVVYTTTGSGYTQLTDTKSCSIQITPNLVITTSQLPPGVKDQDYGADLTATGGTTKYKNWKVISGDLPDGLEIKVDPDIENTEGQGTIEGTPTESGTFPITIEVEDQNGFKATKSLTLIIGEEVP